MKNSSAAVSTASTQIRVSKHHFYEKSGLCADTANSRSEGGHVPDGPKTSVTQVAWKFSKLPGLMSEEMKRTV